MNENTSEIPPTPTSDLPLVDRVIASLLTVDVSDEADLRQAIERAIKAGPLIPPEATEADLFAWIGAKVDSYKIPGFKVLIADWRDSGMGFRILGEVTSEIVISENAATFDEVATKIRAQWKTPQERAADLRKRAAELETKAGEIEAAWAKELEQNVGFAK